MSPTRRDFLISSGAGAGAMLFLPPGGVPEPEPGIAPAAVVVVPEHNHPAMRWLDERGACGVCRNTVREMDAVLYCRWCADGLSTAGENEVECSSCATDLANDSEALCSGCADERVSDAVDEDRGRSIED